MIMTVCSGCDGGGGGGGPGDYPQPSTPPPCFIDATIKPGGQMALELHEGPEGLRWPYWP
jgi:hypothetical protein